MNPFNKVKSLDLSLTLKQRALGKRFYYLYAFFNSFSWAALAGGVVILLLLRLGASETWVGVVTALQYLTLPAMALGYTTVARLGVTGTAGLFWGIRSLSAALMIIAPWTLRFGADIPLWFMFFGSLGFMLGRAAGLISFTGIITELTTERDRGELISNSSKISQFGSILMTLGMALFLGTAAPLYRYQILLAFGMLCGLIGVLFFINGYVQIAFNAAMQHYFISISTHAHQLAHGIITRAFGGLTGGLALVLGGWVLERLKVSSSFSIDPLQHFRWFYGGLLLLLIFRTVVFFKLPRLKSQGIRDALSALFSPWDWRAIHAVKRAISVQSEDEESKALSALMHTDSRIYQADLEHYLRSPSFFIRQRALDALQRAKPTRTLIKALQRDLQVNQFTTAHQAAYWLGQWKVLEAVPLLIRAIDSEDFQLNGAAIHALVELDERSPLALIEKKFLESDNPYVLIEAARAISFWGNPRHYNLLLQKYLLAIAPQAKDDLSLSVARLLGLYDAFYFDLGMLHREPAQLFREWQERFGAMDIEGLIAAGRAGKTEQGLLLGALQRQPRRYQPWFYDPTVNFLEKQPEIVPRQEAFLMAFLLLTPSGFHIN